MGAWRGYIKGNIKFNFVIKLRKFSFKDIIYYFCRLII